MNQERRTFDSGCIKERLMRMKIERKEEEVEGGIGPLSRFGRCSLRKRNAFTTIIHYK